MFCFSPELPGVSKDAGKQGMCIGGLPIPSRSNARVLYYDYATLPFTLALLKVD